MSRVRSVARTRPSWVTSDHLDTSYSTFQLISKDTGTGTGWGRWCVCSLGDHHYTCKWCIPGPFPRPDATCLHESRSCHCTNTLREREHVWAPGCREHGSKFKHPYWIFSLTSLVFPLQQNLHGGLWGTFEIELTEAEASGRDPDLRGCEVVGPGPVVFCRALIHRMPLWQKDVIKQK